MLANLVVLYYVSKLQSCKFFLVFIILLLYYDFYFLLFILDFLKKLLIIENKITRKTARVFYMKT